MGGWGAAQERAGVLYFVKICSQDSLLDCRKINEPLVSYHPCCTHEPSHTVALGRSCLTLGCILKYLLVSKLFFSLSE